MSQNNRDHLMNGQLVEKAILSNGQPMREGTPHANACGAKTRSGKPCRMAAMPNGRCRMHGGMSPKGASHPSFIHGRWSKYIPKNLRAVYDAVVNDKELYSMREEIAVLKSTEAQLMQVIDNLRDATKKDDVNARTKAWNQLRSVFQERNQLVTAERKHLIDMKATLSVESVVLVITSMVQAVRNIVNNPAIERDAILAAVQKETYRLLPPRPVRAEIV
jgi:hypothetical protein